MGQGEDAAAGEQHLSRLKRERVLKKFQKAARRGELPGDDSQAQQA